MLIRGGCILKLKTIAAGLVAALILNGLALGVDIPDAVANTSPPIIQGMVQSPRGLVVDASGNRYVCGTFSGTVDFNPGVGLDARTGAGNWDGFITRFNADGSYAWTQNLANNPDAFQALALSGSTLYACGYGAGTLALGSGGTGSFDTLGGIDAIIVALNAATGAPITTFGTGGVKLFGGSTDDGASGILVSGTNLYVCGVFSSPDAGIGGTGTTPNSGAGDGFIACLNSATGAANPSFGTNGIATFGGTDYDVLIDLALLGSTLYVFGDFRSTDAKFNGAGMAYSTAGAHDMAVLAMNATTGTLVSGFGTAGVQKFGGWISITRHRLSRAAAPSTSSASLKVSTQESERPATSAAAATSTASLRPQCEHWRVAYRVRNRRHGKIRRRRQGQILRRRHRRKQPVHSRLD